MRSASVRLALLLVLLAAVSVLGLLRVDVGTPITLAGGALLLCGIFAGKVARHLGLPRLTGYLIIGILVGPYVLRFIPREGVSGLELVKGLAVALIALTAGTELQLGLIRRVGARVAALCGLVSLFVFAVIMGAMVAAKALFPFFAGMSWAQILAISALVASVVISFSPTVTIAVVQETGARGPFTEFLMSFVIIGDLFVLVAFALSAGLARASFGGEMDLGGLAGGIGWELFGSIGVGAIVGIGTLFYLKRVGREVPLFISVLCFVAAEAGRHLHLSPLLLTLGAGAVIANLDEHEGERLNAAIEHAGLPVFALFFAAVGAGLELSTLLTVGPAALLLTGLRAGAIWFACRKFPAKEDEALRKFLWLGLVSQAGVTFGLAALISSTFPGFGPQIEALILAMVTVNTLVGPVLVRRALDRTGEISPDEDAPVHPGGAEVRS